MRRSKSFGPLRIADGRAARLRPRAALPPWKCRAAAPLGQPAAAQNQRAGLHNQAARALGAVPLGGTPRFAAFAACAAPSRLDAAPLAPAPNYRACRRPIAAGLPTNPNSAATKLCRPNW